MTKYLAGSFRDYTQAKAYKNDVYLLPKELDEKVAMLHLPALGAHLTTLTKEQTEYIGVGRDQSFKNPTTDTEQLFV